MRMYIVMLRENGVKLNVICNSKKGQIQSIVDTYKLVKTPYIFHCEDDWVYKRGILLKIL